MSSVANRNILLGITGGIAAYKTPDLVRKLRADGANVRVVLTASAREFVSPLSLQAVSGHPVGESLLDPAAEAAMGHIELAKWADEVLIAPATANFIAKLAYGLADDLLSTLCLATAAPITLAPAMNQQMWAAAATSHNINLLQSRGVRLLGPDNGEQACGDVGPGRMLEPTDIVAAMGAPNTNSPLSGKHLMITAGPTREAIDPVRYLSNHSSGKMGYALAQAALALGAKVTLVSGPVTLSAPRGCQLIKVSSAQQMQDAVMQHVQACDVFIGCAAVADFRVAEQAEQKLKKQQDEDEMILRLVKNPDILASVAALENPPFTLGFAAETQNVADYAKGKLARKRLNMIAANDVSDHKIGFNSEHNALTLFWNGGELALPVNDKLTLAHQLLGVVAQQLEK
ncbi:bifunctional phosphopantothenoylcysteine decarboxylase/phosphopantothenate--cysteine ligase CoaBC [Bowmanella sp. JS7-9]|uniref:Coenzyme A biosynthesis bifunctional protein CoaBC n=1 Tax=Pseudobowmanella zhangzhouensis TaxID=1537679 RepID=A0ABW1XER5_9ALTE|nr:bifunctional phosphopantothenoylcysteine decarboxylase/phosphopantothenate--cysteine ligase CoaBC [Bowmanella sp. JS7-9]TBX20664.1 phosphopantothenoylcysteine decarboxylase [Bowmanella sp. JS7-9]